MQKFTKGTVTKRAEKLNKFEKFERKKSALFSTQTPPDDRPDAPDHLPIGLVTKPKKLENELEFDLVFNSSFKR